MEPERGDVSGPDPMTVRLMAPVVEARLVLDRTTEDTDCWVNDNALVTDPTARETDPEN